MKLWIRSQNKGALIEVEMLGNIDGIIYSYKGFNKTELGTYKSNKRAIEVLDEIQKLFKPQIILRKGKITGCVNDVIFKESDGYDIKELSTYVYEMPQK